MFLAFRTHLIHWPIASNAMSCCYITKWVAITSVCTGQSLVQTVPACPVQIRAHHHTDVYTDINNIHKLVVSRSLDVNGPLGVCSVTPMLQIASP